MKKSLGATSLVCVIVTAVAFSSCGGSVCDDIVSAMNSLNSKVEPCVEAGQQKIPQSTIDSVQAGCKQSEDNLTDAQKNQVEQVANCIDKLPNCTPETIETWSEQANACTDSLSNLGD